jgi:hypothetical protein
MPSPLTGADALWLWDAVVALPVVPGVLEVSPPDPTPGILGLRLPSRSDSVAQAMNTAGLTSNKSR